MGREDHDHSTVIHSSSIALLQERFKQLQRVKEMREERELMRLLAESKPFNFNPPTTMHSQPSRLLFHPELIKINIPPRSSPPQVSLSISPPSQSKHAGSETPLLKNLWPTDKPSMHTSSNKFDGSHSDSDVDTSLHL